MVKHIIKTIKSLPKWQGRIIGGICRSFKYYFSSDHMKQKHVFITGATGGIGQEACARFFKLGFALILVDNNPKVAELAQQYQALFYCVDFQNPQQLKELCQTIEQDFLKHQIQLSHAFLNAGIVIPEYYLNSSYENIKAQMQINCLSTMYLIRACAYHMRQRGGHILVTVSMGALISLQKSAVYSASKFALRGLLAALYDEFKSNKIYISGIYPSAVDTNMLRYEAQNGGNVLNYLSAPQTCQQIGDAIEKIIKNKKLETYLPYSDSIGARIILCFPWLLRYFYPLLSKLGERGRKRYLQHIGSNHE